MLRKEILFSGKFGAISQQSPSIDTVSLFPHEQMPYAGPIDLNALIDLDAPAFEGDCHWTFLAFPADNVNEYGIPSDAEAQSYIAAIQAAGTPVGIWRNPPVDGTGYAAVTKDAIPQLRSAIASLEQFPESFASELSERLFSESS